MSSSTETQPTLAEVMDELQRLHAIIGRSERKALTYADTAALLGVSLSTLRRMAKQPSFPKPRQFQTDDNGNSVTRFVASEIHDWLERKASRAG